METIRCQHRHFDGLRCRQTAVYMRDGIAGCFQCDTYYASITPNAGERTSTAYGAAEAAAYAAQVAYVEANRGWRNENPQWT